MNRMERSEDISLTGAERRLLIAISAAMPLRQGKYRKTNVVTVTYQHPPGKNYADDYGLHNKYLIKIKK